MINEQSRDIKKPCKPCNYEDEMQGFYVIVIFAHEILSSGSKLAKANRMFVIIL
tara:strand:+ start:929 stop:1090 length:162 start_codon:yes stop_codon:yes gene_type:complete